MLTRIAGRLHMAKRQRISDRLSTSDTILFVIVMLSSTKWRGRGLPVTGGSNGLFLRINLIRGRFGFAFDSKLERVKQRQ